MSQPQPGLTNDNVQHSQQPPAPDPELQRLAPLLGMWVTEAWTQDSLLGPGVMVMSTETFQWLRDSAGAWKPWMSNRFTRIKQAA